MDELKYKEKCENEFNEKLQLLKDKLNIKDYDAYKFFELIQSYNFLRKCERRFQLTKEIYNFLSIEYFEEFATKEIEGKTNFILK